MTTRSVRLEREYDLPRQIVWDALVDDDLVSGWLGEAHIEPEVGGSYLLDWVGSPEFAPAVGIISRLRTPELLSVSTDAHGDLEFELDAIEGGSRGESTRLSLTVVVDVEAVFAARLRANWVLSLEQLDGLLRGHPVEWMPAEPPGTAEKHTRDIDLA